MKKKLTVFLACTALLTAGSGTMWGQAYSDAYVSSDGTVTPRRGHAPGSIDDITGSGDVNNEYGAGETSTIVGVGGNTPPYDVITPGSTPPNAIQIGSTLSENVVIHSYNAGGTVCGWLAAYVFEIDGTNPTTTRGWHSGTVDTQNGALFADIQSIIVWPNEVPSGDPLMYTSADGKITYVKLQNSHNYDGAKPVFQFGSDYVSYPYTTTRDLITAGEDDGVPLVQTIGNPIRTQTDVDNGELNTLPKTHGNGLVDYVRPTTVAISGARTLDNISITDLTWWYRTYRARTQAAATQSSNWATCAHIGNPSTSEQVHGTANVYGDATNGDWYPTTNLAGDTYLDAAVQLLNGANVCVKGSVADNTTNKGLSGINTDKTDAVLSVPKVGNNFALRVGENFDRLDMYEEQDSVDRNAKYPAATFPSTAATDVYLYNGTTTFNFSGNGGAALIDYTDIIAPAVNVRDGGSLTPKNMETTAGILGVNGNYDPANAQIHTSSTGADNNRGVIEVGAGTTGQQNFNIYSGGVLKNFSSSCISKPCHAINFRAGNVPTFDMNGTEPLYILNDGNCCTAAINFAAGGIASVETAVNGAGAAGALHIQAYGNVNIADAVAFAPGSDNNVNILSDKAYITTNDLGYTAAGSADLGHFTVWAKGLAGGSDCGGYVKTGAVNIESSQTGSSWIDLMSQTPYNVESVRTFDCTVGGVASNIAAYAVLDALMQARIQSDNDYVHVNGKFNHVGTGDGALLVQGAKEVRIYDRTNIDFSGATASDAVIQSKDANVQFDGSLTYTGGTATTDLLVDGETGVTFDNGGTITNNAGTSTLVGIQSNKGTILFKDSAFAFDVKNTPNVEVWAGKNIEILDSLKLKDDAGLASHVDFWANDDILTNTAWTKRAPIVFTSTNSNATTTDVRAGRNIYAHDNMVFDYSSTGNMVGNLTVQSLAGNMELSRKDTVLYDSDNTILFSAEMLCGGRNGGNTGYSGCTPGNRNNKDGNIFMNDSFVVVRNNTGTGATSILAQNNIRTAMVNMDDQSAAGNKTLIESHLGDIWLGYSATQDGNAIPAQSAVDFNKNVFTYTTAAGSTAGSLDVLAGMADNTNTNRDGGGNIYITKMNATMGLGGTHPANIMIPYSNEWICKTGCDSTLHHRAGSSMMRYEHAGIIMGVGMCGKDKDIANYSAVALGTAAMTVADTSLVYRGNNGTLTVDAGTKGNIIINRGAYLNFEENTGNAIFTTRDGDIDMRDPFDVDSMAGSLLFYANSEEAGKLITGVCGCKEERNNVYLQDFKYENSGNAGGSVFIGADNNIKLNYGGLQNMGTQGDPFLSKDYEAGKKIGRGYAGGVLGGCSDYLHCDMDEAENKARKLILNFNTDSAGTNLTKAGGFAAVASDKIDVYKAMIYTGNLLGSGMSAAPTKDGLLHGENVAGYGLYMLTKADKDSWTNNILLNTPTCPVTCSAEGCDAGVGGQAFAYLHNTVRMTFHDDARLYAGTQKIFLGSPVVEVFGDLALDTLSGGSVSNITIKTDSLILHDSLIVGGNDYKLIPWTPQALEKTVVKLGYKRTSPPFTEYKLIDGVKVPCAPCVSHYKGKVYDTAHGEIPLDTMVVQFKNDGSMERQNTMLVDHTVLTFQTDSFDHVLLGGVRNAKFYVDTFKIRNQVEFWADGMHTRDAHFELISEEQMFSKDYAGMYTRHLHMEPIGPDCGLNTSELWLSDDRALDVITTSTFGGFGILHADVHVENEGFLAPGFASLGLRGNCYEHHAGTLTMDDLRLDGGAIINVTIGDATPGPNGELLDMVDVQGALTTYGNVYIHLKKRPCQHVPDMCGAINPVLRYNAGKLTPGALNNIFLVVDMPDKNSKEYAEYKDDWDALAKMTLNMTAEGEIYICESSDAPVVVTRQINMPSVAGVTTNPPAGVHFVQTGKDFNFTVSYTTDKPYVVKTERIFDGVQEVLEGKKNANGEYEYVIRKVSYTDYDGKADGLDIYIGPEFVANASIDGNAVWSHNNTIYIKVDRADIASIYSVAGQLVKRVELSEGDTSIPAERGVYIITLKDGSVHKVIVK